MAVYKIDQQKKTQGIKGVQKTRLILLGSYAILVIPLYLDEFIQPGGDLVRDLLFYFIGVSAIVFWFYNAAPKVFSEVSIGPDKQDKNDKAILKDQVSISISRVRFIRETANGIWIHAGWRKLWVPKAINRYDEFKNEIMSNADPKVSNLVRLPALWFWAVLLVLSLVVSMVVKDLLFAYTGAAVVAANISYLLFFE